MDLIILVCLHDRSFDQPNQTLTIAKQPNISVKSLNVGVKSENNRPLSGKLAPQSANNLSPR
ncbi:hypothetical protein [Leptolyngbya sp. FACHB-17]|uniref:hypothetical protein n=1 Tax=unclassified Leptolyngbya TaxID=2650499 RepID=UPI00167FF2E7|nr:hypothetical protein [Leptolyngbya sp. FACHB-17]MBD2082277.1 hypothetical protein [Leptolyngbya sp. FACHB-17]